MYIGANNSRPGLAERVADTARDGYTWLRDYITAIKYGRLHPFTVVERKAREATRKDPWGPTGQQLAELADLSFHPEHCQVIFAVLEFRLTRGPEKWRNVYKALLALEYLLVRGSPAAVQLGLGPELAAMLNHLAANFEAIEHGGVDHGQSVRVRSKAVLDLLQNPEQLQQRRATAAARSGAFSHVQQQYGNDPSKVAGYAGYSRQQMEQMGSLLGKKDSKLSSVVGGASNPLRNQQYDIYASGRLGSGDQLQQTPHWQLNGFNSSTSQPATAAPSSGSTTVSTAAGGFGEAKGVSFEENKLRVAELRKLLQLECNRRCADCQDASPAGRPTWASVNLGVFICMRCAGTHRGLGAHISKVRSCTLDTWLPEQVVFMAQTGNAAANAHFEAKLQDSDNSSSCCFQRPARDSPDMAAFIRAKYLDCRWVKPGSVWPPPVETHPGSTGTTAGTAPAAQPATAIAAATPPAVASTAAIQAASQQQQQQPKVQLAFEDNAFSCASMDAVAAAGTAPPAAPGAIPEGSTSVELAELIPVGDGRSNLAAAAAQSCQQRLTQQPPLWDLMDAPMDVPAANMSVIDWLDQRIETGADAAAQAATEAARQQRHQRHMHHLAAAGFAGQQQQQQQQQWITFESSQNNIQAQPLSRGAPQSQSAATAAAAPLSSTNNPFAVSATAAAVTATGANNSSSNGAVAGFLQFLDSHHPWSSPAKFGRANSGKNVISTYEYTFSSDVDSGEEAENAADVANGYNAAAGILYGDSNIPRAQTVSGSHSPAGQQPGPHSAAYSMAVNSSNPAAAVEAASSPAQLLGSPKKLQQQRPQPQHSQLHTWQQQQRSVQQPHVQVQRSHQGSSISAGAAGGAHHSNSSSSSSGNSSAVAHIRPSASPAPLIPATPGFSTSAVSGYAGPVRSAAAAAPGYTGSGHHRPVHSAVAHPAVADYIYGRPHTGAAAGYTSAGVYRPAISAAAAYTGAPYPAIAAAPAGQTGGAAFAGRTGDAAAVGSTNGPAAAVAAGCTGSQGYRSQLQTLPPWPTQQQQQRPYLAAGVAGMAGPAATGATGNRQSAAAAAGITGRSVAGVYHPQLSLNTAPAGAAYGWGGWGMLGSYR